MISLPDMMKQVMDRLEKLETRIDQPASRALDRNRTPLTYPRVGTAESEAILPVCAVLLLSVRETGNPRWIEPICRGRR